MKFKIGDNVKIEAGFALGADFCAPKTTEVRKGVVRDTYGDDSLSIVAIDGKGYPVGYTESGLFSLNTASRGDRVMVADNNINWKERIFLTEIDGADYPIVCVAESSEDAFENKGAFATTEWKHMKSVEKIKALTMQEIADKFDIPVELVRIKD